MAVRTVTEITQDIIDLIQDVPSGNISAADARVIWNNLNESVINHQTHTTDNLNQGGNNLYATRASVYAQLIAILSGGDNVTLTADAQAETITIGAAGGGGGQQPGTYVAPSISDFTLDTGRDVDSGFNFQGQHEITYSVSNSENAASLALELDTGAGMGFQAITGLTGTIDKDQTGATLTFPSLVITSTVNAAAVFTFRLAVTDTQTPAQTHYSPEFTVTAARQPAQHEMAYFGSQTGTDFTSWTPQMASGMADVSALQYSFVTEPSNRPEGVLVNDGDDFYIAVPSNRLPDGIERGGNNYIGSGDGSGGTFTRRADAATVASQAYTFYTLENDSGYNGNMRFTVVKR